MKVEIETIVELTGREAQAIREARDTLCTYEQSSSSELDDNLVEKFENEMGYTHTYYSALCTTIDFLTFLLRESGNEKEEY